MLGRKGVDWNWCRTNVFVALHKYFLPIKACHKTGNSLLGPSCLQLIKTLVGHLIINHLGCGGYVLSDLSFFFFVHPLWAQQWLDSPHWLLGVSIVRSNSVLKQRSSDVAICSCQTSMPRGRNINCSFEHVHRPLDSKWMRRNVVGSGVCILKFGQCPRRSIVQALPPLTVGEWFVWEKEMQ